mgnify:CR=1 FL=1
MGNRSKSTAPVTANTRRRLSDPAMKLWTYLSTHCPPTWVNFAERKALQIVCGVPTRVEMYETVFELHEVGYVRYEGYLQSRKGQYAPYLKIRLLVRARSVEQLVSQTSIDETREPER